MIMKTISIFFAAALVADVCGAEPPPPYLPIPADPNLKLTAELIGMGKEAVSEQNQRQKTQIEFLDVLRVDQDPYRLTLAVMEGNAVRMAVATINFDPPGFRRKKICCLPRGQRGSGCLSRKSDRVGSGASARPT